jgi:hypothetical protein
MKEVWKDIVGYEGLYEVSSLGNVKSLPKTRRGRAGVKIRVTGRILRPWKKNKYDFVGLAKDGVKTEFYVHRLVASSFLGEKHGLEVNHKDGDRNNNSIENLEWVTHAQNIKHAYDNGLCTAFWKGKVIHNARKVVTIQDTSIIEFPSATHCANYLKVGQHTILRKMNTNKEVKGHTIYSL